MLPRAGVVVDFTQQLACYSPAPSAGSMTLEVLVNLERLKAAETAFLNRYPGGFAHDDMVAVGKRHKLDKTVSFVAENFKRKNFQDPALIVENMAKLVGRSSMVSMFEKPKFRDFCKGLSPAEKNVLSSALKKLYFGDEQKGFEGILQLLLSAKMGKWSVISTFAVYLRPDTDVFVKPTTAKGVIDHFQLENLAYRPQPSWEFYTGYRDAINEMKQLVDPSLSPSNPAFTGFLMMTSKTPR